MNGRESRDTRSRMLNQMDQYLRGRRAARTLRRLPRRLANRRTPVRGTGDYLDGKDAPLLLNNWLNWEYHLDEGSDRVRIRFYERGND
jgi:hypothetical protein